MRQYQDIESIIKAHGGFISKGELTSVQYHRLLSELDNGSIVRVRKGVYALQDALLNTMYDMGKIVPDGVLCTFSAWSHFNLTTQIPQEICIAIRRGRRIVLPDYPPIKLYHQSEDQLNIGRTKEEIAGYQVEIFDIERCVCDAVKYRNKIGIDVCSEILKNYLSRKGVNLSRLSDYAKALRIETVLHKYLEIAL